MSGTGVRRWSARAAVAATAVVAGSLVGVPVGGASIATVGGATEVIAAPPSVAVDALQSNTRIRAFEEAQDLTLGQDVAVDITEPGVYADRDDLTPGTIAMGTSVDSHFLHADPVRPPRFYDGVASFDTEILGVAIRPLTLDGSDFLGAPTTYPTGSTCRGPDLVNEADVVILPDRMSVQISVRLSTCVDQVRVITAAGAPPPPPDCTLVQAGPASLWPPNHKFRTITLTGLPTIQVTGVTQDEPLNGQGDGNTSPDAQLVGGRTDQVQVRSERQGGGDGRVYRIAFTGSNAGGSCTGTALVGVPHDRGGSNTPIDSGLVVNSFGP